MIFYAISSANKFRKEKLNAVDTWCNKNEMALNSIKCQSFETNPNPRVLTLLHGHQLKSVDSYKYLDVDINKLDWTNSGVRTRIKLKVSHFYLKITNVLVSSL